MEGVQVGKSRPSWVKGGNRKSVMNGKGQVESMATCDRQEYRGEEKSLFRAPMKKESKSALGKVPVSSMRTEKRPTKSWLMGEAGENHEK